MRMAIGVRVERSLLGAVCAALVALGGAAPASALPPEPDFVFLPNIEKGPDLVAPCGLGLDESTLYAASHYRHSIDEVKLGEKKLESKLSSVDPLGGPCGLAFDSTGKLYVNNYHRNVSRYTLAGGPLETPLVIDSSHPTGVAVLPGLNTVYVNARTHIAAYDASGAPLLDGGEPLRIGEGSLTDGYGLAVSSFPATIGRIYAPDWADNTVKVYDPAIDTDNPMQTIAGPPGGFGSLRDSAVAVDRVTGEIYVADTLSYPQKTERPQAIIRVFDATGAYKGRLKYGIVDASPPGLAVDNSGNIIQGRVYVTSGNHVGASIYAYPPNSATNVGAPAKFSLSLRSSGSGSGSVLASSAHLGCETTCEAELPGGARIPLSAVPEPGSAFTGWSGGGCAGTGECVVQMSEPRSVSATFEPVSGPPAFTSLSSGSNGRAASASAITQKGNLRVRVTGNLAPRRLPRQGEAPVSVSVAGEIATTDQTLPPKLEALRIELNRHGHLDRAGLPICSYDRIQPGSSGRALAGCRSSLVGRGSFTANITLAGQEPYPTKGRLLLFNSVERGKPVIYGHIYSARPFPTSFVIVFEIQKVRKGTYGILLNAPLPRSMDSWGRLTGLEMTLSRRYSHRGERHSYISASCPAPKGFPGATFPLARTSFAFGGGKKLTTVFSSTCKARG